MAQRGQVNPELLSKYQQQADEQRERFAREGPYTPTSSNLPYTPGGSMQEGAPTKYTPAGSMQEGDPRDPQPSSHSIMQASREAKLQQLYQAHLDAPYYSKHETYKDYSDYFTQVHSPSYAAEQRRVARQRQDFYSDAWLDIELDLRGRGVDDYGIVRMGNLYWSDLPQSEKDARWDRQLGSIMDVTKISAAGKDDVRTVDTSGWGGVSDIGTIRSYSPEKVQQLRQDYESARVEYEVKAYKLFGSDWQEKLTKFSGPMPAELTAWHTTAARQGGLTTTEMALYETDFTSHYGMHPAALQAYLSDLGVSAEKLNLRAEAYTRAVGFLAPREGETEQQSLFRIITTVEGVKAGAQSQLSALGRARASTEAIELPLAGMRTAGLELDIAKASELLEPYKAAYDLKISAVPIDRQLATSGTSDSFMAIASVLPDKGGAARAGFLATSVFFGEMRSLGQLVGFRSAGESKYDQPIDVFSVWNHPATSKYTLEEKALGALVGGGAAFALQFKASSLLINPVLSGVKATASEKVTGARMSYYISKYYELPLTSTGGKFFRYTAEVLPDTAFGKLLFKSRTLSEFFRPTRMLYAPETAVTYQAGGRTVESIIMTPSTRVSEYTEIALRTKIGELTGFGAAFEHGGPVSKEMLDLGLLRGGSVNAGGVQKGFTGALGFSGEPIMVDVGLLPGSTGQQWSVFSHPAGQLQYLITTGGTESKATFSLGTRVTSQPLGQTTLFGISSKDYPSLVVRSSKVTERVSIVGQELFLPGRSEASLFNQLGRYTFSGVDDLARLSDDVIRLDKGFIIRTTWETAGDVTIKPSYKTARVLGFFGREKSDDFAVQVFRPSVERSGAEWGASFQKTLLDAKGVTKAAASVDIPLIPGPVVEAAKAPAELTGAFSLAAVSGPTLADVYGPSGTARVGVTGIGDIMGPQRRVDILGRSGSGGAIDEALRIGPVVSAIPGADLDLKGRTRLDNVGMLFVGETPVAAVQTTPLQAQEQLIETIQDVGLVTLPVTVPVTETGGLGGFPFIPIVGLPGIEEASSARRRRGKKGKPGLRIHPIGDISKYLVGVPVGAEPPSMRDIDVGLEMRRGRRINLKGIYGVDLPFARTRGGRKGVWRVF